PPPRGAQVVPSSLSVKEQVPSPLQVALAWHWPGMHVNDVPPQTPPVQTSLVVQGLPSSQAVRSGALGLEQPVIGSHVPWAWQGAGGGGQGTGIEPARG